MKKNAESIERRWLDAVLSTYSADAAVVFKRGKDPFANPIGHTARVATQGIFEALTAAAEDEELHRHVKEIVKIRAVQEFSASEAVRFVFQLKEAVRAELATAAREPGIAAELLEFEGRIDRVALAAFDTYVQCREQVSQLRINEAKRNVSWIVEKMSKRDGDTKPPRVDND